MAFNDLFVVYPNKNAELRSLAKTFLDFGRTVAKEPSAALSSGLDEHALKRQRSYVDHAESMLEAFAESPIPDMPATHPTLLEIDCSDPYKTFVEDINGQEVPLNEQTQLLSEYWLFLTVGLAKSQSAGIAGSIIKEDLERAQNNVKVITKLLNELEDRPTLDLPETTVPGSKLTTRSRGRK